MKEIDDSGFSGGRSDLNEYARLNSELFHDKVELAGSIRQFRGNTPFSQWSSKDWDEAIIDVAMSFGRGSGGRSAPKSINLSKDLMKDPAMIWAHSAA